jgi:hypothetical protein
MKTLDYSAAQPFIDAGCRVDGAHIVGPSDVVAGVLIAMIGGRTELSREEFSRRTGVGAEWLNSGPMAILDDSGWGRDREGNLIGGDYEISRAKRLIETIFEA